MKALVIYDLTGRIWQIIYNINEAPQGITCMWVDIPDGAIIERIDVTDPKNPQAVFSYLPESDIGRLQKRLSALEVKNVALEDELTNTQLALVDFYEEMSCKDLNEGGDV